MTTAVVGRGRGESLVVGAIALLGLVVVTGSVATGHLTRTAPAVTIVLIVLAMFHEQLLSWRYLVGATVFVILFVPIRRYSLPASLPINLEPYRVIVGFVIVAWLLSLLIDRRVTVRASGFELPIFAFLGVLVLSLLANIGRVDTTASFTVKSMSFMISYVVVFYIFVSVLRTSLDIDLFVRLLVAGGGVVGALALFESVTHMNIFNHISTVLPFLQNTGGDAPDTLRGGGLRVYGSAQHPIALGAAFAVLIPLAVYVCRDRPSWRWRLAGVAMLVGLFATRSRTGVTMLIAIGVVYALLRFRETLRFWPAVIPLVLTIHFAVPGAIGSIKQSFFPRGGLIAQENRNSVGSGRLATFGPVFRAEFEPNPVLGEGYATRVIHPEEAGLDIPAAPITDDEWLALLAETGMAGVFTLGWIFIRSIRRMGGAAKKDHSSRGFLLVSVSASVAAYAVGMLTYDSFAFIQTTFLFFFVLAIGASTLLTKPEEWGEPTSARKPAATRQRLAHAHG